MTDEPIVDFSKERRRRAPLISQGDIALAGEFARASVFATSVTEKRFETAMENINVDPTIRRAIQAAYEALANPDAERARADGILIHP